MNSSPSLIRILAVDDHPMLREGIASLVASQSDMALVAEASTGCEALERFREHRPDLTLGLRAGPAACRLDDLSRVRFLYC